MYDSDVDEEQAATGTGDALAGWADAETGEEVDISEVNLSRTDGLSEFPVTSEQQSILLRDPELAEVLIRPDGAVYVSHSVYRKRLNEAFRPMGWGLKRIGRYFTRSGTLAANYALYINGHLAAEALGEQQKSSSQMTLGDQCEGVKSNALLRACKDLGMFLMCWDKAWVEQWKADNAVAVWTEGNKRPQWRLKNAPPLFKETGQVTAKPAQAKPAPKPAPQTRAEPALVQQPKDRPISDAEAKVLWAQVGNAGIVTQPFVQWLKTRYKISRSAELTLSQYTKLLQIITTGAWTPDWTP